MKRLLTLLCLIASITIHAQEIKVRYTNKTSDMPQLMQQYFNMQNILHLSATVTGDYSGKRIRLKKVVCDNGAFSERELFPDFFHLILNDSTKTFDFMTVPYGTDSIRITCFYPDNYNRPLFNDTVPTGPMRILMETYTPGEHPDTPIMAYTTGIPTNGGAGSYFCGLRDSGVDPWKWHEKYGINGYVFYTVRFEEDTPADPNAPYYIKVTL